MRIDIAVPNDPMYKKLLANKKQVEEKYNVRILAVEESKCSSLMLNNRVSAALLTPIGYGNGVKTADYRIIPGPSLASYYYTGLASIIFNKGLRNIERIATSNPNDFIVKIGLLLLSENYGINPEIVKASGNMEKKIAEADAAIVKGDIFGSEQGMDISEEWFMFSEMALPLAMWVCHAEEYPEKIVEIVKDLADDELQENEITSDNHINTSTDENRSGKLIWNWNDEFEQGLDHILQFLYYLQHIPEIAGIKVLGRDDNT